MWTNKEEVSDNEILEEFKETNKSLVEIAIERDGGTETPYGYFVDAIKDNFNVTLEQCDRVAKKLVALIA